jgi:hypothetical protein
MFTVGTKAIPYAASYVCYKRDFLDVT